MTKIRLTKPLLIKNSLLIDRIVILFWLSRNIELVSIHIILEIYIVFKNNVVNQKNKPV